MKTVKHLLLLLLCILASSLYAETVTNYKYDFNTALSTSSPDFAPIGWGHLVDYMDTADGPIYMTYEWVADAGVDNTGCLKVGSQTVTDGVSSPKELNDMIVLPPVLGAVSVNAKSVNYGGSVSFYYINYENGKFSVDGAVDMTVPELSTEGYTTITLPEVPDGTLIGIRANSVYLDNITAEQADIIPYPRMKIQGFKSLNGKYVDTRSDGKYTLSYKVAVTNNGQRDLKAGEDNYSISLINMTRGNVVLATKALDFDLAMGQTDSVTLTADIPYSTYPDQYVYGVKENMTESTMSLDKVKASPYTPVISLYDKTGNRLLREVDFGIVQGTTTDTYLLRNDGSSDLNIESISTPDGVSVVGDPTGVVAPHDSKKLTLTFVSNGSGFKQGTMTVNGNGTKRDIPVKAISVGPDEFYVNFEDGKMPVGFIVGDGWSISNFPTLAKLTNNGSCILGPSEPSKLVTPKLEIKDGENLYYQAGKTDSTSFVNVYYSADRKDWTLVQTVKGDGADGDTFSNDILDDDIPMSYAFRTYTVTGLPAGNYYIAFESGRARVDNIFGCRLASVDHDVLFQSSDFPAVAQVNNECRASVTFANNNVKAEEAGTYTVSLYVGGEKTAEAAPSDFLGGEIKTFDLSFTPHQQGSQSVYALMESGKKMIASSDTVMMNVLQETAVKDVQVGTPTIPVTSNSVPLYLYYKKSMSNTVYTAAQLNLKKGARITKLTYNGWCAKALESHVKVYIANTSVNYFSDPITPDDTTRMTCIYDGNYTFPVAGKKTETVPMLSVILPEPFVYDGTNLSVLMTAESDSYADVKFETDGSVSGQAIYRASDTDYSEKRYSTANIPVVTISTETDPVSFSGTVKASETDAPIENATVSMTSGNTAYFAKTGADGVFNMSIYQYDKSYDLRVDKVGFEPYKQHVDSLSQTVNAVMKKGHGLYIDSFTMPATGTVNHKYIASAEVINVGLVDIKAADYTASLLQDGKVVATAECVDLKAGEKADFSFMFTPYLAATGNMSIAFRGNTSTVAIPDSAVVFSPESLGGSVQVLDSTSVDNYSVPVRLYDKNSESQTIYTASQLKMSAGNLIHRIAFRGYNTNSKVYDASLRVYLENTKDTYDKGFIERDTTQMTRVYNGMLHVAKAGSKDSTAEYIVVDIPDGFRYTGNNIRVAMHVEASTYAKTFFVTDKNVQQTYYRSDDKLVNMATKEWTRNVSPVMYLETTGSQTLSGRVVNHDGDPLPGVSVTLAHDNVRYFATTDSDGSYSMIVAQTALDYDATFELAGYTTEMHPVNLSEGDVVLDVAMSTSYKLTGIVLVNTGSDVMPFDNAVVTLNLGGTKQTVTTANGGRWDMVVEDAPDSALLTVKGDNTVDSIARTLVFEKPAVIQRDTLKQYNIVTGCVYVKEEGMTTSLTGASVSISQADKSFNTTSREDGSYTFRLPAANGIWTVKVEKEGYVAVSVAVNVSTTEQTSVPDIVLEPDPSLSIVGIDTNTSNEKADAYTVDGKLVGRGLNIGSLRKGVYIISGKKVVVK